MNRYLSTTGILMMTCLLLLAWAGGVFASQDYQSDVLDKMNQEQHYTQGPGWVIPSTLNTQNETNTQNTTIAFNNSKQEAVIEPAQDQNADLPLKGPKGGGEQVVDTVTEDIDVAPRQRVVIGYSAPLWLPGPGEAPRDTDIVRTLDTGDPYTEHQQILRYTHEGFFLEASDITNHYIDTPSGRQLDSVTAYTYMDETMTMLIAMTVSDNRSYDDIGQLASEQVRAYASTEENSLLERKIIENLSYNDMGNILDQRVTTYASEDDSFMLDLQLISNLAFDENGDVTEMDILSYQVDTSGEFIFTDKQHIRNVDPGYYQYIYQEPDEDPDNTQSPIAIDSKYSDRSLRVSDIGYEDMQFSSGGLLDIVPGYGQYTLAAPSNFAEGGYFAPNDSWTSYDNTTEDPGLKYARDLYFIRLAVNASQETQDLGDIVNELSAKADRTDIENNLLEAVQAVMIDSEYIDEGTAQGFSEAARYVRMAESMKGILEGVDFTAISRALEGLVKEQSLIYSRYVNSTEDAYAEIAKLLGISVEDEKLPDQYAGLVSVGAKAKLKILSDISLRKLTEKEKSLLSDNEKEALKVYEISIKPLLNEYKVKLIAILDKFIFEIKKTLMSADAATTVSEGGKFQALFLLNKKQAE